MDKTAQLMCLEDILVELYFGALNQAEEIAEGAALPMNKIEDLGNNRFKYEGHMLCLKSGQFGFTVRLIPQHKHLARKFNVDMAF